MLLFNLLLKHSNLLLLRLKSLIQLCLFLLYLSLLLLLQLVLLLLNHILSILNLHLLLPRLLLTLNPLLLALIITQLLTRGVIILSDRHLHFLVRVTRFYLLLFSGDLRILSGDFWGLVLLFGVLGLLDGLVG